MPVCFGGLEGLQCIAHSFTTALLKPPRSERRHSPKDEARAYATLVKELLASR